jgi:glycosyltransferase 2 family protein
MNPEKKQDKKIFLLLIFGLAAFIVYFLVFVDPAQFVEVISQTNLSIYSLAFVSYIMGVFFSSMAWYSLLNTLSIRMSPKNAFLYTWVGLFFDATIPQLGLSGDVAKSYFFSKNSSEDIGKIGASAMGQKIIVLTITAVSFTAGLILLMINYALDASVLALIAVFTVASMASLFIIYYVSVKPKATETLLKLLIRVGKFFRKSWDAEKFKQQVQDALGTFHDGFQRLKANPRSLVLPALFAVLSWTFDIGVVFLAFTALGAPIPVDKVLIVYTITGVLQAVGIGFFTLNDIIMNASLWALGIPAALAFSVTLLTRAVTLWFRLIISYGAFQWTGVKLARQKTENQTPN